MMKIKKQKAENCLEAAQIKNKISHLEKNKIDVDNCMFLSCHVRISE